jgi:hypothetical protein
MWSKKVGNEIYVYRNGKLVYKKWLDDNGKKLRSVVFDKFGLNFNLPK